MEKEKSTDEPQKPFTEKGQRDDEVELVFKDEQKLYVSRNLLSYASPVFEAMFSHDFIEKQENKVDLESKDYEDFLDFLLCLHPGLQKEVDESNVLRIIPIAEEYQVQSVVSKCRAFMKSWLDKASHSAKIVVSLKTSAHNGQTAVNYFSLFILLGEIVVALKTSANKDQTAVNYFSTSGPINEVESSN